MMKEIFVEAMCEHHWNVAHWLLTRMGRKYVRMDCYMHVYFGPLENMIEDMGLDMPRVGESADALRILDRLFSNNENVFYNMVALSVRRGRWFQGCVQHAMWKLLGWLCERARQHRTSTQARWRWADFEYHRTREDIQLLDWLVEHGQWWLARANSVLLVHATSTISRAYAENQECYMLEPRDSAVSRPCKAKLHCFRKLFPPISPPHTCSL